MNVRFGVALNSLRPLTERPVREEWAENYGVTGFMSNAPDQWL
jgi:hypothetical protein